MKKAIVIIFLCTTFFGSTYAQPWLTRQNASESEKPLQFFEVKKAYYDYAKDKPLKFKGYKQFKRWEYYMESRVDESGFFPAKTYWNEYTKQQNKRKLLTDKSSAWSIFGPNAIPVNIASGYRLGVGRIDCIEFHPSDTNIIFVGSPTGGLWKTTTGGNNWDCITNDLPALAISDIVINPNNPDIMYIASGDRDAYCVFSLGVLKTTDGGNTWDTTGLNFNLNELVTVSEILMHPNNPDILLAATNVGIYRSTNAGSTWTLSTGYTNFKDMAFKPDNPDIIYAGTFSGSAAKLYKSTDGGISFALENSLNTYLGSNAQRLVIATTAANPDNVYVMACKHNPSVMLGIYKSTDGGNTWPVRYTGPNNVLAYLYMAGGQAWYDMTLAVSPINENRIVAAGVHMWKSDDGGTSYDFLHDGYLVAEDAIHADFHEFRYHPVTNALYVGCDGGIYRSYNHGNTWTDISNGLQIIQSYRISASETFADLVVTGNQDNGSMRFFRGICNEINGADGMDCIIDYADPSIIYTSYQFGDLYRSTDTGYSYQSITPSNSGNGAWTAPFIIHPTNHNILYAGYDDLFKSTNKGNTWVNLTTNLSCSDLRCIQVAPSDDNYIYIANENYIWKTTNGGTSWSNITSNLPSHPPIIVYSLNFYNMAVSADDPNTVWLTYSNFIEGKKVFKTTDGGLSWTNISKNLPNLPVNSITYEKGTCDGVYVGTDAGIFYMDNTMTEWIDFSNNLPNVPITDLHVQNNFHQIVAGTYGRSLWYSNTYYKDQLPVADFKIDSTSLCAGNIKLINTSLGNMDSVNWDFGDGTQAASINAKHHYSSPGNYNITLYIKHDSAYSSITKPVTITQVLEPPVVNSVSRCGSGSVTLTASASHEVYWYNSPVSSTPLFIGAVFVTPTLSSNTTYYIANVADSVCVSEKNNAIITILPQPVAGFNFVANGSIVDFNNTSTNSLNYYWNFGDGDTSIEKDPTHIYSGAGNYMASLITYNQICTDTATQNISIVGIEDNAQINLPFKVYPNPNSGAFFIEFANASIQNYKITVYDAKGIEVKTMQKTMAENKNYKFIKCAGLLPGIYFLQVQSDIETFSMRIVVK